MTGPYRPTDRPTNRTLSEDVEFPKCNYLFIKNCSVDDTYKSNLPSLLLNSVPWLSWRHVWDFARCNQPYTLDFSNSVPMKMVYKI